MPSICDSTVTLKGETEYWSLLGVKGFKQQQFITLSHNDIILKNYSLPCHGNNFVQDCACFRAMRAMCRWVCNRIFWINPKNSRETTLLSWKHQGWMIHKYSSVKTASFQNIKPDNTAKKYFLYTMYTFLSHSSTGWPVYTVQWCTMFFIILINKKKKKPHLICKISLTGNSWQT